MAGKHYLIEGSTLRATVHLRCPEVQCTCQIEVVVTGYVVLLSQGCNVGSEV